MTPTDLLALRHRVPDATLLDCMELAQLLPELPCRVRRSDLEAHWQVTQPALHRRLRRLQHAGLLDYETEHGTVWANRIGPISTPAPLINEIPCGAVDLSL